MTKAQLDFIARQEVKGQGGQDARAFLTWYHPDDIHRLAYRTYQANQAAIDAIIHSPVMILGSDGHSFEQKMRFAKNLLMASKQQILPFIIAPEIGAAHFMSGFIRKDEEGDCELFLFNPTGYTPERAEKRLAIEDINDVAGMTMHVSSLAVQTTDKDQLEGKEGPALVSCGPISLMFIEHLLKNPQYALQLDQSMVLPESLVQLEAMAKEEYQQAVLAQRQRHFQLLGTVADSELEAIDAVYYQQISQFLTGVQQDDASEAATEYRYDSDDDYDDDYDDEYSSCSEDDSDDLTDTSPTSALALHDYQARARHYQVLAEQAEDLAVKALYIQAQRINERASAPSLLNFLGALLAYNEKKVSFADKASHLNQVLDQMAEINRTTLAQSFSKPADSALYGALNETTMTLVDKTTAVLKIEQALSAAQQFQQVGMGL